MSKPTTAHPGMSDACNFALDFQLLAQTGEVNQERFNAMASQYSPTREGELTLAFPDGSRAEWIEAESAWKLDESALVSKAAE